MGFDILGSELCEFYDAHLSMRQGFLSLRRRHIYPDPTTVKTSLGMPQVRDLIGKRIADVVWRKNGTHSPRHQLFLVFEDDTHYEIYAPERLKPAGGVDSGGLEHVLEYAHKFEISENRRSCGEVGTETDEPHAALADAIDTIEASYADGNSRQ
jgi:hypothetical protein